MVQFVIVFIYQGRAGKARVNLKPKPEFALNEPQLSNFRTVCHSQAPASTKVS